MLPRRSTRIRLFLLFLMDLKTQRLGVSLASIWSCTIVRQEIEPMQLLRKASACSTSASEYAVWLICGYCHGCFENKLLTNARSTQQNIRKMSTIFLCTSGSTATNKIQCSSFNRSSCVISPTKKLSSRWIPFAFICTYILCVYIMHLAVLLWPTSSGCNKIYVCVLISHEKMG